MSEIQWKPAAATATEILLFPLLCMKNSSTKRTEFNRTGIKFKYIERYVKVRVKRVKTECNKSIQTMYYCVCVCVYTDTVCTQGTCFIGAIEQVNAKKNSTKNAGI